jgi:hypothetical protein
MRVITCNEIEKKVGKKIMGLESIQKKDNEIRQDISKGYNEYKEFEGRKYTGMKVGGTHQWNYERGEWREKKTAPDKWEFTYATNKRRAWNAPEGSGVPVGTEYHWYVLAHQNVRKLDANSYTTSMTGFKYKLAHKRVGKERWSSTENAQRERIIQILEELIAQLKREMVKEVAEKPAPTVYTVPEFVRESLCLDNSYQDFDSV